MLEGTADAAKPCVRCKTRTPTPNGERRERQIRRPSSASSTCRYEDYTSLWIKKRIALKQRDDEPRSPPVGMNTLTSQQRSTELSKIYARRSRSQSKLLRHSSDLKGHERASSTDKSQGKRANPVGVVQNLELTLRKTADYFGYDSVQVSQEAKVIVKFANQAAMRLVEKGDTIAAISLFKRAESAGKLCPGSNALTYNNMACAYKRLGRLESGLDSIESALCTHKIGGEAGRCISLAAIRLNYGVILSAMGRHRESLQQIRASVYFLRKELFDPAASDSVAQLMRAVRWTLSRRRLGIFPIALYNLAVELEILGKKGRALEGYRMALYFAKKLVGKRHNTTATLEQRYRQYQMMLGTHKPTGMGLSWVCDGSGSEGDNPSARISRSGNSSLINISLPCCE
uniref:MalT-like TPR region domain-containing protein n=1 Tax=Spongospora subterranea TaxID=70186 RepID=A0A0H5RBQ9_9EUKA|eukprot:CRZ11463.1 hypothetical protein [Spongospora subterranea]